jgi:hypothetical protein
LPQGHADEAVARACLAGFLALERQHTPGGMSLELERLRPLFDAVALAVHADLERIVAQGIDRLVGPFGIGKKQIEHFRLGSRVHCYPSNDLVAVEELVGFDHQLWVRVRHGQRPRFGLDGRQPPDALQLRRPLVGRAVAVALRLGRLASSQHRVVPGTGPRVGDVSDRCAFAHACRRGRVHGDADGRTKKTNDNHRQRGLDFFMNMALSTPFIRTPFSSPVGNGVALL